MNNKAIVGLSLGLVGWMGAAIAHTIQATEEVAATFHIEPDHNPRAGQPAQAWFALTLRGGQPLPLAQCDCQLRVDDAATANRTQPLLTPTLQPLSTEQYRAIPSATITFPQPGAYTLTLKGSPKAGATFQPFEFRYGVVAIAGSKSPAASQALPQSETPPNADRVKINALPDWSFPLGVSAVTLTTVVYSLWKQMGKRKSP